MHMQLEQVMVRAPWVGQQPLSLSGAAQNLGPRPACWALDADKNLLMQWGQESWLLQL